MSKILTEDGREFVVNERGQKVDEDGFFTSAETPKSPFFCVAVKVFDDGTVGVRDTKDPERTTLKFSPEEWAAFTAGVKNGEFDT